ncbi:hypothetical protein KY289_028230 [Solanum tuberosum]|nr:hypothetical protein KY289_028230 [Solanum tuberosum]
MRDGKFDFKCPPAVLNNVLTYIKTCSQVYLLTGCGMSMLSEIYHWDLNFPLKLQLDINT